MSKVCKKTVANGVISFAFANGTTRDVKVADFDAALQRQAMVHGFAQKLGDSYAGAITVSEAVDKFDETLTALQDGDWNTKRQGTSMVVEAIARALGIEVADAAEKWAAANDDTQKAIKGHPDVKRELAAIKAERAAAAAERAKKTATDDTATDLTELFA